MNEKHWTEGVLDDGAVILCDGERVTISDVLARLNHAEHVGAERDALRAENAQLRDVLADRDMDREMAARSKLELIEANRQLEALRARIDGAPSVVPKRGAWDVAPNAAFLSAMLPRHYAGKRVALVVLGDDE